MLLQSWAQVLTESFQAVWFQVISFAPNFLIALFILAVGWLIGSGLGRLVGQVVAAVRVDAALRNAGIDTALAKAGYALDSGAFLGALVKWFVIAIFLVASLDVLGLTAVNEFLQRSLLPYLPQVIVAVIILLLAAVIADVVQNIVRGAAAAADVPSAQFMGTVAKWAIWIFAVMAALNHLQVAPGFVQTLFTGIVVAFSLAVGLAFGLGGQKAASELIERLKEEVSRKESSRG
jgi:hypothetical protein